ncbi:MAG: uroporphyrinogen-III C-methyltransferase [Planctomycetota bacterium]|nr:uroporphyrinogen-III C-methyltransferase [Planctomycetota bacterium]
MPKDKTQRGVVVLLGAGPGDPDLLTVAGQKWLRRADVVIYDRLAPPALLRLCRDDAELIYAGKVARGYTVPQEQIAALMVEKCRAGKCVVRLKGGDPLIFGRGGEEAEAMVQAGCAFRIVPGVTAGAAAGAYAGIPLTHRRDASAVAFVTGQEDPEKEISGLDWDALAKIETLVFYMAVGRLDAVARQLMQAGRAGQTPAAIIQQAATPMQRTIPAELRSIAEEAKKANVQPPAIIIIGDVAAMRKGLAWFEKLPMFGKTILVTRASRQAEGLSARLGELGAEVIVSPTVVIEPPESFESVDAAMSRLSEFDWLVLTSPNGASALTRRLAESGMDARALGGVRLAAIGPATAEVLREKFIEPDLLPETFTTDALAEALTARGVQGKRLLLVRADIASEALAENLRVAGAEVEETSIYRTGRPAALADEAIEALRTGRADWITFTSSSTVENFLALAPSDVDLSGVKLAAIGPVTAGTLRSHGLDPAVVAWPHTIDALVEAIASLGR